MPEAQAMNIRGTPKEIFDSLRSRLIYTPDPGGNELLQELATLFNTNGKNYHGLAGAGVCDCFTIAALAVLINAGYNRTFIVLTGYSNEQPPVHIFPQVYMANRNVIYSFDLTQRDFNTVRKYPFYQRLKFSL